MPLRRLRAAAAALVVLAAPAAARTAHAQGTPARGTPAAPARPAATTSATSGGFARTIDVDRVVAVVGATPILYSDLLDELNMRRAYGLQLPTDSAARQKLERDVLGEMVDAELLVQKAKEEKDEVSDEELGKQVDDNLKQIRAQYPGDTEYRNALRANGFGSLENYLNRQLD